MKKVLKLLLTFNFFLTILSHHSVFKKIDNFRVKEFADMIKKINVDKEKKF